MKQTAVEWLYEVFYGTETFNQKEVLKKAKKMEKEQIIEAYKHNSIIRTQSKAEQYYKETFKQEEQ